MKNLLLASFLLVSYMLTAQIPVTDVSTGAQLTALNTSTTLGNSTLASQLSTAGSQLAQLERTYEQIQKASDKIEKVNEAIKSVETIQTFITQQKEIISNVNLIMKSGKSNINYKKTQFVLQSASSIVKKVSNILSDNFFNLNDKERVDMLEKEKKQMAINLVRSRLMLKSVQ